MRRVPPLFLPAGEQLLRLPAQATPPPHSYPRWHGLSLAIAGVTLLGLSLTQAISFSNQPLLTQIAVDRIVAPSHLPQPSTIETTTPSPIPPEPQPVTTSATPDFKTTLQAPILLYHETPVDFDHQLQVLQDTGYSTISLDELAAALHGQGSLPPKPVIITFDDGFADQLEAAELLSDRQLKATFYIINGGEASHYCIGANRYQSDCGDDYLSWDQIRTIDENPLFTIGSHTTDHLDLSTLSPAEQQLQIFGGKAELETELGHAVYHFAYPYGAFTADTINLVKDAGFATAVTTQPGTAESTDAMLTMPRVRSAYELP